MLELNALLSMPMPLMAADIPIWLTLPPSPPPSAAFCFANLAAAMAATAAAVSGAGVLQ